MPLPSRRGFLRSAAALAATPLLGAERRRNVLFLAVDDLNECLSCYGHPAVRTPNIDRIARAGVRFDRAYCQYPLCSPSRSSLMTGLAPDTTGVYDLQRHFRASVPDALTLPQLFRRNGYVAARVGKIYHYGVPGQIGTNGLDDAPSWDSVTNPAGVDKTREEPLLTNYTPTRGLGSAICFHASSAKDEEHTDGMVAARTVELLEAHRKEPFFLAAGFYRPHVPWIAPAKYFDLHPLKSLALPSAGERGPRIAPDLAYWTNPDHWGMSEAQQREAIQAYYASISFLDAQVGKVLDALERLRLGRNTTIVLWSDHGYQLGEHGQWMKSTLFEASARVPFLLGGAGVSARGRGCGRTVELLDIYPTLAGLCGLQGAPDTLHGRSLAPLLARPDAAWDKPAITQVRRGTAQSAQMGYSLRTERHRYTRWVDGERGEELYDYRTDPREGRNLADDAAQAGLKRQLGEQLHAVLARRGKQG